MAAYRAWPNGSESGSQPLSARPNVLRPLPVGRGRARARSPSGLPARPLARPLGDAPLAAPGGTVRHPREPVRALLSAPLPSSFRRKAVCVWQVAALMLSLAPVVEPALAGPILASALAALMLSFAADVAWLRRNVLSDACWQESV